MIHISLDVMGEYLNSNPNLDDRRFVNHLIEQPYSVQSQISEYSGKEPEHYPRLQNQISLAKPALAQ